MGMITSRVATLLLGLVAWLTAVAQTQTVKIGVATAATAALVDFLAPAFQTAAGARVEPEFLPAA
jgi:ABC-type molybdate transport system substrate-binding protein